jgi:hypothetical protein
MRVLQVKAFTSIQLAPTLAAIAAEGRAILDDLYRRPCEPQHATEVTRRTDDGTHLGHPGTGPLGQHLVPRLASGIGRTTFG